MAELTDDPKGWELEDLVAAHFVSRGCYVETGIKERSPDEILELDLVWTDYRSRPDERNAVEVKSGDWGIGDLFKFYGWTQYLGLGPGQFVHKQPCGRVDAVTLTNLENRTGVRLVHIEDPEDADKEFKQFEIPEPAWAGLSSIWRFSFWAQRRLLKALGEAAKQGACQASARAAKEYHRLINDAVFFIPDVRDRIDALINVHFQHQELGRSAALEQETGRIEFGAPSSSETFRGALFHGKHFPIQACLYLAHRARVYIMKALVDYWLLEKSGGLKARLLRMGKVILPAPDGLTSAMRTALPELSRATSFCLFPAFWQVFLWGWGGFLLKDRIDEEYSMLSADTGVPVSEIPLALSAFDKIFPIPGGWFREPQSDSMRVMILMPAVLRGIGAFHRRRRLALQSYREFGYTDLTMMHMAKDHNSSCRLLDCSDGDLVK